MGLGKERKGGGLGREAAIGVSHPGGEGKGAETW